MIETLKILLGLGPEVNYEQLVKEGALILDVRTKEEYKVDHIPASLNISVDQLKHHLDRLPEKEKVIITCCASGLRSRAAKNILQSIGYKHVYNGGSFHALRYKIGSVKNRGRTM
jgi:phage shock protein E